jgi:hypothetical protein
MKSPGHLTRRSTCHPSHTPVGAATSVPKPWRTNRGMPEHGLPANVEVLLCAQTKRGFEPQATNSLAACSRVRSGAAFPGPLSAQSLAHSAGSSPRLLRNSVQSLAQAWFASRLGPYDPALQPVRVSGITPSGRLHFACAKPCGAFRNSPFRIHPLFCGVGENVPGATGCVCRTDAFAARQPLPPARQNGPQRRARVVSGAR